MAITAAGQSASSLEYYARINAEKETIKNQAAGLESAAQEVKTRLETFRRDGLFAYLYDNNKNSSAFRDFSLNALRSLVKSYNQLNENSAAADRLSDEGKHLLDKVKALLKGPGGEMFRDIGLELNDATGAITFNEQRFADQLAAKPQEVRRLLLDKNSLGAVLQNVIDNMLAQPALSYFNSSFILNA
jgi:hypothetical protein